MYHGSMRIILASDHGGYELKEKVREWLLKERYEVKDVGAEVLDLEDDFVDYAVKAVVGMVDNDKAILFCRNGFGMSIVANRFKGIRCGVGFDVEAVAKGRSDDNINALAIPADYVKEVDVKKMITTMLEVEFSTEEKYKRRLEKVGQL